MRIPKATWLSGAGIVFLAGLLTNGSDLILTSGVVMFAGFGAEAFSAIRLRRQQGLHEHALQSHDLEQRLIVAETALASAMHELASLKQEPESGTQLGRAPGSYAR